MVDGLIVRLRGIGPYVARSAIDSRQTLRVPVVVHPGVLEWATLTVTPDEWGLWYIAGRDGQCNVLTFPDQPGAVFTDRESAQRIANEANGVQP